ncbi:MAG TPA: cysteine desulfurase family protein [Pseudogracilibacillus sp.]|nr:cysteine desulfurase family protein [Pseudogracilibacillus sp.]
MIYLDHAATTPVHEDVLHKMYEIEKEVFGNPSSIHAFGREAKRHLDEARRYIASSVGAREHELIFTSGGTEANNLAIVGTALANEHRGNHIITSAQEHHAVLNTMRYLQKLGFHITYVPVDASGKIRVDDIARSITEQTILVSIMAANNETGVKQPIEEIGQLLSEQQVIFHTDAVQAFSSVKIDVNKQQIDLLTASAHKINGPKGVGFLYVREDVGIEPLQFGGLQERERRPGTENVVGAVGFHYAVKRMIEEMEQTVAYYTNLKETFLSTLRDERVQFSINGNIEETIPTIVNLSFPDVKTDIMLANLDIEGIAASSGSACSAGTLEPSHVLQAMYKSSDERIWNSIRFSFGYKNDEQQMIRAAKTIAAIVERLNRKGGMRNE